MKRKINKRDLLALFLSLYSVFTVVQNLFEMKTIGTAELAIMGGGTIVSWIPFIVGDITTEIYGSKKTIKLFTIAGIINLFVVLLAQLVIKLPGTYPEQNEAFTLIFSNGLRTALASFIAFWVGNYINTNIMSNLKKAAGKKDNSVLLFLRAVLSTVAGQFVDNGLFLIIAFAPIHLSEFEMLWGDILSVTFTGTLLESGIETVLVPFITIPLTKIIKNL